MEYVLLTPWRPAWFRRCRWLVTYQNHHEANHFTRVFTSKKHAAEFAYTMAEGQHVDIVIRDGDRNELGRDKPDCCRLDAA